MQNQAASSLSSPKLLDFLYFFNQSHVSSLYASSSTSSIDHLEIFRSFIMATPQTTHSHPQLDVKLDGTNY